MTSLLSLPSSFISPLQTLTSIFLPLLSNLRLPPADTHPPFINICAVGKKVNSVGWR